MSNVILVDFRRRVTYRPGDRVHHEVFGVGTVVRVERAPSASPTPPVYVLVRFDGEQRPRLLNTAYAVMRRVKGRAS